MAETVCCHPECTEQISSGIACRKHWGSVDKEVQKQVQWRLRQWKNDDGSRGNRTAAIEYLNHFFRKQLKG